MDELQLSISTYKIQLEQVRLALQASDDDENRGELSQLVSDLNELISISEENLLEMKRKELLAQLPDSESEDEEEELVAAHPHEDAKEKDDQDNSVEDEEIDLSSLEGVKCKAPHFTAGGHASYHDAIIFSCESSSDVCDVINVRVVFSHPTQPSMLPCPFFLAGKCRFDENSCKYSHGEVVPLSTLKEYEEPDFNNLAEGLSVLAKDSSDHLWHHATIEGIEGGDMVHLRFSHNNKSIYTVPIEMVLPLSGDPDFEESEELDELGDFAPEPLLDRIQGCPSGPLGDWEQFTRGMGSKLMASMGYIMGAGLGKRSEGRIEPVPAMLYPVGRSLDWCMNLREKAGGGDALTVEKTLKRQQAREEKKTARRMEAEKGKTSVFDFINNKLGGKRGNVKELIEDGSFLRKGKAKSSEQSADQCSSSKSSSSSFNVENFRVSEEIRRTEKEILKLKESYSRLKDRDPKTARSVEARIRERQDTLKNLHSREKSIHAKQSSHNEKKKLAVF